MPASFKPRSWFSTDDPVKLRRELVEFQQEVLSALNVRDSVSPLLTSSSYAAKYDEIVRVSPPAGGFRLLLPTPHPSRVGSFVRLVIADRAGQVTIEVSGGLINKATTISFTAGVGFTEFRLDDDGWYAPSLDTIVSTSTSIADAEYVLGAANASLPNGRVATDSTEIDADLTTDNVISWALHTASVVLAKLQDLTGLSVLGRAANSAGVMAAITATDARQALMSDSSGTAIAWRSITTSDVPAHTWSEVLAAGNTTDGTDAEVSSGDALNFASGSTGITSGGPLLVDAGSDYVQVEPSLIAGDPGSEASGIDLEGTTYESVFKVSDIGTSNVALLQLHRHSTALEPLVLSTRSNSTGSSHAAVTSGQALCRWFAAGHDGTHYALAGWWGFFVDGTPGTGDMPGRFAVATTPDGSQSAVERLRISNAGAWGLAGANFGSTGYVISSNGSGAPPTWEDPDTLVTPYTAGDGLDLSSFQFSADVSDFAGEGLEDDGSNNLRIAIAVLDNGGSTLGTTRRFLQGTDTTSILENWTVVGGVPFCGYQRAALTGEVTASQNSNDTSIDRSTDFGTNGSTAWTGHHRFEAEFELVGHTLFKQRVNETLSADKDDVDMSGANVYRVVGNNFTLSGMTPNSSGGGPGGQLVLIDNADSTDALYINNNNCSTAAHGFFTPGAVTYRLPPKGVVWAIYDDTNSRWHLCGASDSEKTASLDAAATKTNSLVPLVLATLAVLPDTLAAGACFEFFAAADWSRTGTTATSVTLEVTVNGTTAGFYTTATSTSGVPGDAGIHGFLHFLAVGASGSIKGRCDAHEVAPVGSTTSQSQISMTGVDTTSLVTIKVQVSMTVATSELGITANAGFIQRRASSGSTR